MSLLLGPIHASKMEMVTLPGLLSFSVERKNKLDSFFHFYAVNIYS